MKLFRRHFDWSICSGLGWSISSVYADGQKSGDKKTTLKTGSILKTPKRDERR